MHAIIGRMAGSTVVHVGFAFLVMGGWAVWANRAHPLPAPVLAGLVQGALSAGITLCLKTGLDALRRWLPGLAALLVAPVIALSVSLGVLVGLHWLAGTPEILATITLPYGVAVCYGWTYNTLKWRAAHD